MGIQIRRSILIKQCLFLFDGFPSSWGSPPPWSQPNSLSFFLSLSLSFCVCLPIFHFVSQVNICVCVPKVTPAAHQKWRINLVSRASWSLRTWWRRQAKTCVPRSSLAIKSLTVGLAGTSFKFCFSAILQELIFFCSETYFEV